MIEQVFTPGFGNEFAITNSVTATAAQALPPNAFEIVLTNTSTTARVHITLTPFDGSVLPTGIEPTLTTGLPILPSGQIRIRKGAGNVAIRAIATAADGVLMVNPGNGG